MSNERVSQLQDLFASDVQVNDVFLVTDMSQRESKKLEVGTLLTFIESSGSFFASRATISDTASYIKATNINGIVAEASLSTQSLSASHAVQSISSSYSLNADTASYSSWCVINTTDANTASYLKYSGTPNGTSSYSLLSNNSNTAVTALNLFYSGTPNGTSSYSISSSYTQTSSYASASARTTTASFAISASYAYYTDTANNANNANNATTAILALTSSYVNRLNAIIYSIPLTSNVGYYSISHGLGYIPSLVRWTFAVKTNLLTSSLFPQFLSGSEIEALSMGPYSGYPEQHPIVSVGTTNNNSYISFDYNSISFYSAGSTTPSQFMLGTILKCYIYP